MRDRYSIWRYAAAIGVDYAHAVSMGEGWTPLAAAPRLGKALGLTAPRSEGQVRALHRAYGKAGFSPATLGLVEAHGTGTVVGDRTELATLTAMYADSGVEPGTVTLGSVKSQIGRSPTPPTTAATERGTGVSALAMLHKDQSDHDQRRQDLHRQKNGQHYIHLQLQKLCASNGSAGDKGISGRPLQYSKNQAP